MKEFKATITTEIKKNFNLKADKNVGKIAVFIITYDAARKLTNNQIADLIVELKQEAGLLCECSGSCIAWYRNKLSKGKLQKVETIEERKTRLEAELKAINKTLKA
jgi:hypothetical protein